MTQDTGLLQVSVTPGYKPVLIDIGWNYDALQRQKNLKY
jgi:hypothetical protein